MRFINCLTGTSAKLKFRDEEDQISTQYFCRIKSAHMNFSNNPTFVSGSLNEMRHTSMKGNPATYITTAGLYNDANELLAVAKLSRPLPNNFTKALLVRAKLDF